ncbi:MAG: Melibiose carrier protein [Firmicutes bacterium ADurb.Bin080]|nr:MFS transporter [Clostridiales bacterium]OQC14071.1 MAG: Melibiose carrier protein [Firmicutes bacterium ADurb.Bin080]
MKAATSDTIVDSIEATRVKQFNKNKWFFSLGGIGRDMSYQLINAFLLTYVQFGVSLELVQFTTLSIIIGVGGRLWDAVNDPVMGAIIEGSHLKWGKFKPWIMIGAIGCGAIIILMFTLRVFTGWAFVAFLVVAYLLWETTYTMNDIGYWAMLPSLSSKEKERNQVTMLTVIFAGLGAFIGQGLITFFTPGNVVVGYRNMSIIIVASLILCQALTTFFVKETPRTEEEKQSKISLKKMWKTIKNNDQLLWMALSLICYSVGSGLLVALAYNLYYLEVGYDNQAFYFIVIFGVCSIAANALYTLLANKLGRKKLQLLSAALAILGYIGVALLGWTSILPFNILTLAIFGVLIFTGQTLFYMATIINMTNCVEYNEYTQGERNEAVVSTLRPFVAKFSSALQYGIVTLVLVASGIYILSQNISTMESQKNFLSGIKTSTEQIDYISDIQDYFEIYENALDKGDANNQIETLIAQDGLTKYQLKVSYLQSLADCKIFRTTFVNGEQVGDPVDLGIWKNIDGSVLLSDSGTTTYVYSMELIAGGYNAANLNFKESGTLEMRIWMRIAVCGLPIILIAVAWLIQNKKFKIDEKFYNQMLETIAARHTETLDTTNSKEASEDNLNEKPEDSVNKM